MIKRAIFATDLSKASDLMMDCLPQCRQLGIEHISLLHVPTMSFNYMEYSGYSMRVHIEARMLNLQNRLSEAGFKANFAFREGLPSQEILDFAAQQPDALIVIGSKGQGFFKRNLIGSTTLRVMQQSKNPVLMIRIRHTGSNELGDPICILESRDIAAHALLLTDFSKNSDVAFGFTRKHLAAHFQRLTLMHVQDKVVMKHHDKETIEKFNLIDNRRLRDYTLALRKKTKAPVSCTLVEGSVVPEIIREVKENNISLVIFGAHGKSYFSDMVLGSAASAILHLLEANCLLIPMSPATV